MSELHKFIFDGLPVRGMLVRLTDGWQELLRRREAGDAVQPPAVRRLVGEMAAASVLMQASVKFDGTLVLQVYGDGPVKLAVAEAQADLTFRATATVIGEVEDGDRLEALVNVNGRGRCSITLDPAGRRPGQQPYQGVVGLRGDQGEPLQELSEVLEHYMLQSEQLDTRLVLAADDNAACGLLVQRLPVEGAGNLGAARNEDDIGINEDFNRISALVATMGPEELLSLDADTVLRRLFWDEPLRRFEPSTGDSAPRFACSCSRERVGRMLKGLGADEVDGIVAEQGRVEIGCEFCGKKYHFDAVDVGEFCTAPGRQAPGSAAIN